MKHVVIWAVAIRNWLWVPLAERLKEETGARIHFICNSDLDVKFYQRNDPASVVDGYTSIGRFHDLYDVVEQDEENIVRLARSNEARYGLLAADVLQSDRHLGRGYTPLGVGHPRSKLSEKATYLKSLNFINRAVRFWEDYLDERPADLVVGTAGGVVGLACTMVARERGIPIRTLGWSRYKEYFYWSSDRFLSFPKLKAVFDGLNGEFPLDEDTYVQTKRTHGAIWASRIYGLRSPINMLRMMGRHVAIYAYRKVKKNVRVGNVLLSESLKLRWRTVRRMKELDRTTKTLAELAGTDYVYYPMQTEPETALGILSPEFNEQLAVIQLVAKNLPAGVRLAIKEHVFAIGRRPRGFFGLLAEIPNVVLLGLKENSKEIIRGSRAVAVISSTGGFEAAVLGIPVIAFGRHNPYEFLPHVHRVDSWTELRPLLHRICLERNAEVSEGYRSAGSRLIEAAKRSSFLLPNDQFFRRTGKASHEEVEPVYIALMESLREAGSEATHGVSDLVLTEDRADRAI